MAIKTLAGFAIFGVVLAVGFKSERQFTLENDDTLRPLIESAVRANAAEYNPNVNLTVPELKDFSMGQVQITRSRIGALLDSAFGNGDLSYDVYARFRESGGDKCLTMSLDWRSRSESWNVAHGAYDRCTPVW